MANQSQHEKAVKVFRKNAQGGGAADKTEEGIIVLMNSVFYSEN
jgi:hypothetical protein